MHDVTDTYRRIISGNHWKEVSLVIGEQGDLVTEMGDTILFGGTAINIASTGAAGGYRENMLISVKTKRAVFADSKPQIGACVAGKIDIEMLSPVGKIPAGALLAPYVRVCNETEASEWIKKGVYYADAQETTDKIELKTITLHGSDSIVQLEEDYIGDRLQWPSTDIEVAADIAASIGVQLDTRTRSIMTKGYTVQLPAGYSKREVLGYLAAMYTGNFIMSDDGTLLLLPLNSYPPETSYLVDNAGYVITFGGVMINV